MKFHPPSSTLYTDDGRLIKRLACPRPPRWADLPTTPGQPARRCDQCERSVFDTAAFSDDQLLDLVRRDPSICLKVSSRQANCSIQRT